MSTTDQQAPARGADDTQRMAKAMSHPLRAQILARLNEDVASPVQLSKALGHPVARVAYHVKLLEELDCIELVELRPVRGSVEHLYRATRRVLFEDDEWDALPESVRTGIACQTLRDAVGNLARSIDSGAYAARADVHMSRSPLVLDQEAWTYLADKLRDLAEEAVQLAGQVAAKDDDGGRIRAELLMTLFPLAPRPDAQGRP